jgi:hypothetical protein
MMHVLGYHTGGWACQKPAQESESRESWMAKECKPTHAFWWLPRLRPPDLFVCFSDRKHISTFLTPPLIITSMHAVGQRQWEISPMH